MISINKKNGIITIKNGSHINKYDVKDMHLANAYIKGCVSIADGLYCTKI